jgi:hypothetical protein
MSEIEKKYNDMYSTPSCIMESGEFPEGEERTCQGYQRKKREDQAECGDGTVGLGIF